MTLREREAAQSAAPFIDMLAALRNELRAKREFELADGIRKQLESLGVTLEDSAGGTRWRVKD
jgi:cysteinyl-tRNA synthetase